MRPEANPLRVLLEQANACLPHVQFLQKEHVSAFAVSFSDEGEQGV
jgi:hypothetical protein